LKKRQLGQEKTYSTVNNWAAIATAETKLLIRVGIEGDFNRVERHGLSK
jgi:hypothetical protein